MSPFQDFRRVVNGLSLVAKEIIRRPASLENTSNGDIGNFIFSVAKKAIVSVTDLAGVSKGSVYEFSKPREKESVVFFSDSLKGVDSEQVEEKNSLSINRSEVSSSNSNPVSEDLVCIPENLDKDEVQGNIEGDTGEERGDSWIASENSVKTVILNHLEHKSEEQGENETVVKLVKRRRPRERRVPSTPLGRAIGFAGLGAGIAWGTLQESAKRLMFGTQSSEDKQNVISPLLSPQNAERLALALCRMRGAALKLGQMLSMQDESLVPAPILVALDIVRQGADIMPRSQLNRVLDDELGLDWTSKLQSFDYEPLASASIGQVHRAVMKNGMEVAMKIQYPGVADSIDSDIENVRRLLEYTNLIPKGLFLEKAMKVAKDELSRECDYELEAANQKRFYELLSGTEGFYVPVVIDDISCKRVLTTELVSGIPIDKVASLDQVTRDYVGTKLLELTLKELFVFRFMQTDPNWSNFLYDGAKRRINLIDFGAARDYPQSFVDDYLRMVLACANNDRDAVIKMSQRLGFLTGMESEVMLDAHVQAAFVVGLPFSKPGAYDFGKSNIILNISNLGATMLMHRLTPPPDEAYSLHRKLSGAFLACIKLGAVVPCRQLLLRVYEQYRFRDFGAESLSSSEAMG